MARLDLTTQLCKREIGMNGCRYVCLDYDAEPDAHTEHSLFAKVDGGGALTFNIVVKGDRKRFGTGTDLFISMMNRFAIENIEIRKIRGIWERNDYDSTNGVQYLAARRAGASPLMAASVTWTGRRAAQYGFTKVAVAEGDFEVFADFTKPSAG